MKILGLIGEGQPIRNEDISKQSLEVHLRVMHSDSGLDYTNVNYLALPEWSCQGVTAFSFHGVMQKIAVFEADILQHLYCKMCEIEWIASREIKN